MPIIMCVYSINKPRVHRTNGRWRESLKYFEHECEMAMKTFLKVHSGCNHRFELGQIISSKAFPPMIAMVEITVSMERRRRTVTAREETGWCSGFSF
jgi:hypothetical protein